MAILQIVDRICARAGNRTMEGIFICFGFTVVRGLSNVGSGAVFPLCHANWNARARKY